MPPELQQQVAADIAEIRVALARGSTTLAVERLWRITANVLPCTTLAKEIGNVCRELGFSAMAGQYWYLLDDKSEDMEAACKDFEDSVGGSPSLILHAFALAGLAPLSPSAKTKLLELRQKCTEFHKANQYHVAKAKRPVSDTIALLGCAIVGSVIMFVFVAGVMFIARGFR